MFPKKKLTCGRELIISNNGGVSTAVVGFEGFFSHKSFSHEIEFEGVGSELFLADSANLFPEGLSITTITILNDNTWIPTDEVYRSTDILDFPLEIQAHSSIKIRVAFKLHYETLDDAKNAYEKIQASQNADENAKITLQFTTSTSKKTKPVEFDCFDNVVLSPF